MEVKTFTSNGDYNLPERQASREKTDRIYERTSVVILNNPDPATLTFGVADDNGDFVGYVDGAIADDGVINHGFGAQLMVRIASLTTTVKIGLSD